AEETRFWRNQQVEPENQYGYDSLYQLVSASGREKVNLGQQNRSFFPADSILLKSNHIGTSKHA
ncbi:hypothetical protein CG542_21165, partial [Salmonella enterica]|nr:hypothetical protein [Salmonella enterica]EBI0352031.1 hypothetical protein [Salmonella enterica subsp. arizonae serovar 48:z4,z23,z32:-]EBI4043598.1 hypothetical protein [Salmonella enterica]EBM5795991.1 hypothetical protein [Salmonella enterica]EBS9963854.1 hypothetical protein [Salmonella enterica]